MSPLDPDPPGETPEIREPADEEIGVTRSSGLLGKSFEFWSRFLVWSQLVAIVILGSFSRVDYGWLRQSELVWFVVSGAVLISALHAFFICPIAVLIVSLGNPKRRDGCLLIVLELLLAYAALIAFLPGVQ